MRIEKSTLKHVEAGEGLFAFTKDGKDILPGTLLGFFPGIIYSNLEKGSKPPFSVIPMSNEQSISISELLPFPNYECASLLEILDMKSIMDQFGGESLKVKYVKGNQINCYALGNKINHASGLKKSNVIPLTINIRSELMPLYLRRFIPSVPYSKRFSQDFEFVGFFSSSFIPSGSELLMNYGDYYEQPLAAVSGRKSAINWLESDRVKIDEEYLVKREYRYDISPLMKKILDKRLPIHLQIPYTQHHMRMLEESNAFMQKILDHNPSSPPTGDPDTQKTEGSKKN